MHRARWFVFGAVAMLAIVLALGLAALRQVSGFSAHQPPSALESWLARRARTAAMPAEAKARANPIRESPEVLAEARAHWADHCAACHSNDGSGDALMGRNLYPPAPDMRRPETQQMTDGELFYIIQNGVRLTGMPAWGESESAESGHDGSGHDEEDSWKLVQFIRHLPQLTLEEKKEMEKLNPEGPEDRKEEEEEERFLRGEDIDAPQPEHHHHH
jgi:mono/diheme cytochrome c family protein